LDGVDVGSGVGADGPVGEHLVDGVGFGGALDVDGIGLVDCPGGKAPQGGRAGGFGLVANDREQFGAFAQGGGVAPGGLRARAERGEQLRIRDIVGLGDPAVPVLPGQSRALGAAGGHEDRRRRGRQVVNLQGVRLKIPAGKGDS
jgi:hypothetical protein